ncbi:recombinase family protein [Isoptericola halotolerans]|uniref:DNA invertase Pin-like site-specific DNA recombinase n=1 Tax=Isoptericola halotolerans TaxID=300560 RepID=A0ABX2A244_9MICO|nr:recombinase family protein [Isoptericola halotolerans]NOV96810.1 DNA invertase Pin-like site-specific DNA recombinase [Isoptericola halotolerans]
MEAVIYVRISRDREGAGLGVDRQEADCRELADRLGWNVVQVHSDNDLSAYSGKPRPGYRAMLEDLRHGRANAVVAWHSDRLHRKVAELEEFVAICDEHKIAVQTVRSGSVDLATASGRMVARMLGAASQHEIDHARERMQRAKRQAAAAGKWRGGPRPFGYEADGVTVRPSEAEVLLRAARGILAGRSLNALARELNEAGITTTRGSRVDGVNLRTMLLRPRNAGLIDERGEIVGDASWPAIIPEDIWRGVVATLSDPTRTTTTGPERRWLGSGLYRCGVCRGPLRASKQKMRHAYRCTHGSHVTRDAIAVDEYVRQVVVGVLSRPDAADLLAESDDGLIEALRAESESLRARLSRFEADYAEGAISGRQLRAATERVEADLEAVNARLAGALRGDALGGVLGAASPGEAFLVAPLDVQRAVLDALAEVTINKGRKGRPRGWKPGEPYVDLETVEIKPRGIS